MSDDVDIHEATTIAELDAMREVFVAIWDEGGAPEVHLTRAVQWSGGYAAVAVVDGRVVGGAMGFIGLRPGLHLHSHIAGVLPGLQDRSIGFALKQHQRSWCAERELREIRWTYDPLVRRNAWFNLRRLGAEIESFHPDFYGDMHDGVNAGDRSDRFLVRWATDAPEPSSDDAVDVPRGAELFALPEDIVALRRTDPQRAAALRLELRAALEGRRVAGLTDAAEYVIVSA